MHVLYCAVDTYTTPVPVSAQPEVFPGNTPVPCHVISAPGRSVGYPIKSLWKSNPDFAAYNEPRDRPLGSYRSVWAGPRCRREPKCSE